MLCNVRIDLDMFGNAYVVIDNVFRIKLNNKDYEDLLYYLKRKKSAQDINFKYSK